jgi:hypothetical protein
LLCGLAPLTSGRQQAAIGIRNPVVSLSRLLLLPSATLWHQGMLAWSLKKSPDTHWIALG